MLCYNELTPLKCGDKQSWVGIAEGCVPHKFNETEDLKMGKVIVAEKIMDFRRKNNLTQSEFGNLLGVSAQAISKWERELCYPDITILPDLAHVLGCTVNDFFEERET